MGHKENVHGGQTFLPGVNFTNVLRAAFTRTDPKSAIKLLNLTVFHVLLGSARVKAACRMMVKLTPAALKRHRKYHSFHQQCWLILAGGPSRGGHGGHKITETYHKKPPFKLCGVLSG